uniref:Uncharacterized protein n=1 Tax=Peronospora matthiolae TaxID=2874970 RepID=A0AAV1V4Q5_9STRA
MDLQEADAETPLNEHDAAFFETHGHTKRVQFCGVVSVNFGKQAWTWVCATCAQTGARNGVKF